MSLISLNNTIPNAYGLASWSSYQWAKLALLATLASSSLVLAQEKPAKPAPIISELSLTFLERHDSNVFGTDYQVAGVRSVANVASWVTLVSPKVNLNLIPAFGREGGALTSLNVGYSGDASFYHSASTETNVRNNFTQSLKFKTGAWSSSFDNTLTYVAGADETPQYSLLSAYGSASARERREQFQDRAKVALRYDTESWFTRFTGTLLYYDLRTLVHKSAGAYTGWQNYVDRNDLNSGLDFGFKVAPTWVLTAGYRYGTQYQQALPLEVRADGKHNNSHYSRFLVGLEGKLLPWLKIDYQVGPDFRSYEDRSFLGIKNASHTWLYSEGSVTADFTQNDSLTFTNKIWSFVSSTGVATYLDSTYNLSYKHKFGSQFAVTGGIRVLGSDYDAPTVRRDWLYTYSIGARYDISKQVALTTDYARTQAHNRLDEASAPGREYSQDVLSFGIRVAL